MKFSVLLPTRNRLEYLKYAIETVRRQNYADWEIIVSDNCSEDDIRGYVLSLNDGRIRYFRTESFVPVTDNWNNALKHSTGDYVVMLGDDDGLLPHYFSRFAHAFKAFPDPDFVYVSAYFYAYPGVMPDNPDGFVRRDRNGVFTEQTSFWLTRSQAAVIARGYLDFRMPVASNMQFSLISRRKIDELSRDGAFFKSPYPDFYATPMLFLESERILIYPFPMVIVGITPKSYGFFHFNNRSDDGVKFLKNDQQQTQSSRLKSLMLPGTSYNDSWLLAMESLRINWSERKNMLPNYRRYRFLQIVHCYKKYYFDRVLPRSELAVLRTRMNPLERLVYGTGLSIGFSLLRRVPQTWRVRAIALLRRFIGQHSISKEPVLDGHYDNLVELFEALEMR